MAIGLPPSLAAYLSNVNGTVKSPLGDQKHGLYLVLGAFAAIYVTSSIARYYKDLKMVNFMPGFRIPFSPFSIPGLLLPETWWNPGYIFLWRGRVGHNIYKQFNAESFSVAPWLVGAPMIFTSNMDVLRQVAYGSHKTDFEKPEEMSRALTMWGQNLAGADGETWRKHRRVVGPAFNNKLYQHVWSKTEEIYEDMVEEEGWTNKDVIEVPVVQKLTFQLALIVISTCGFGLPFNWVEPPVSVDGSMTIQNALRLINERSIYLTLFPRWVRRLPLKFFYDLNEACDQMSTFMTEQVSRRRDAVNSGDVEDQDAFTLLVKANEEEGGKGKALTDSELIGNVYVMLFAGHETTAHTLAATLAYLASNPDIQQDTLDHIISVVGWDRKPTFEDYNSLDKVLAVFSETLRMFPSGHLLFRKATKDTVLQVPRPVGQEGTEPVPIPKGGVVVVDMVGVQYNPRYFDEPEKFKPSRWEGVSTESEAFTAFSVGPRGCIGRKFATTEAVCFLTLLIRDWKLEPLMQPGENLDEWKARVLDAKLLITLGVKDAPIRFVRRKKGGRA